MAKEKWEIALEKAEAARGGSALTRQQVEEQAKTYGRDYKRMRGFVRAEITKVSVPKGTEVEIVALVDADEMAAPERETTPLRELIVNGAPLAGPALRARLGEGKMELILTGTAQRSDLPKLQVLPLSVTARFNENHVIEGLKTRG